MSSIAYELREEYQGTVPQTVGDEEFEVDVFQGGVIAAGERDIDVKAELDAGGGRIVVSEDEVLAVNALDAYPALKRIGYVDDAGEAVNPYELVKATDLKADANARGLEGAGSARKDDLVVALTEHDARLAEGSLDELGAPVTIERLVEAAATREEA